MLAALQRFHMGVILTASLVICGCTQQLLDGRKARPSDNGEVNPGFLIEQDVRANEATEVTLGNTTISIPKDSAASDYRIRLTRRTVAPDLTPAESAVLGSPSSDVIDVSIFDPSTKIVLSSKDLLMPYEFKQKFATKDSVDNLGFLVVTDEGTSDEKHSLLQSSEVQSTTSEALGLTELHDVMVSISLKVTSGVIWCTAYTDDAIDVFGLSTSDSVSSVGNVIVPTTQSSSTPEPTAERAEISSEWVDLTDLSVLLHGEGTGTFSSRGQFLRTELSGLTAILQNPTSNTGPQDAQKLVPGILGNGIDISVSDSYSVLIDSTDRLSLENGTVLFWYKPTAPLITTGHGTALWGAQQVENAWQGSEQSIGVTANQELYFNDVSTIATKSAALEWTVDQWYFLAATWSASGRTVYRDGVAVGQEQSFTTLGNQTFKLVFGVNPYFPEGATFKVNAVFDEMAVWKRALSAAEIEEIYIKQKP